MSDEEGSRDGGRPQEEEEEEEGMIRERSSAKAGGRPRKRLVKKSVAVEEEEDEEEEEEDEVERRRRLKKVRREEAAVVGKGKGKQQKKMKGEKEMKEMWESVAGDGDDEEERGRSGEDDDEGVPDEDDDRFIDDTGVPEDERRVISDGDGSEEDEDRGRGGGRRREAPPEAEEAEEGEEEEEFGKKKKNKKLERTPEEIAMFVEQFMAKLDVAAEQDADLNRRSKPAIEKLKMLGELWNVLQKRQLQQEFLDRGVLSSLKNWLEPLPDGSLPNMNIRTTLLKLLTDLPIDVEHFERREQLKKSGLGKVVMFLSRLPEETSTNKKLARDLVDKWSRPIFQKSTRYEDLRTYDEERPMPRRTPMKKPVPKRAQLDRGGDELDMMQQSEELKRGDAGYRQHASRPEALPLDFVRRPQSKVDPHEVENRARQQRQEEKRMKMNKKLQQLKTTKKNMQASKISVEGRGVVNYLG